MMILPVRLFLLFLVWSNVAIVSVSSSKECITISRGKELKQYVQSSPQRHVLVVLSDSNVDDDANDDDRDDVYKELCNRLENTPTSRVEDFEIALVVDSNLKRHVMKSAKLEKVVPAVVVAVPVLGHAIAFVQQKLDRHLYFFWAETTTMISTSSATFCFVAQLVAPTAAQCNKIKVL